MKNHKSNSNTEITKGGARPMKVFVDNNGNEWICDKNVNLDKSLAGQSCWRTDQMAFDRNF